jgi:probable rRNA maturation factor
MSDKILSEVDILVEAEAWSKVENLEATIQRAVDAALAAEGGSGASISLMLGDDTAIRVLNASFRGKDKPTNVLSFPAPVMPGDPDPALGDIALAYETCAREAEEEGKTLADHLTHLVIHGTLHLLGYDHETEAEAEAMEALETRILAGLGIADPYADSPVMGEPATRSAAR